MNSLIRIAVFLRHLAANDDSFEHAKMTADSVLNQRGITREEVEAIANLMKPDMDSMSHSELSAELRNSISATLVSLMREGPALYGLVHSIQHKLPK